MNRVYADDVMCPVGIRTYKEASYLCSTQPRVHRIVDSSKALRLSIPSLLGISGPISDSHTCISTPIIGITIRGIPTIGKTTISNITIIIPMAGILGFRQCEIKFDFAKTVKLHFLKL